MNDEYGTYYVSGNRRYRGHEPGTTFDASLERNAERRAVARGDIKLVKRTTPTVQPGTFTFPAGWLQQPKPRKEQ